MLFTITFLISAVFGQLLQPDCRYAATDHHYPIGVCESDRFTVNDNTTIELSFRFICDDDGGVIKEYFDGLGCMGEPALIETNTTGEVIDYSCDAAMPCSYAMICGYDGCGNSNDTTCSKCVDATPEQLAMYDMQCRPTLSNECFGFDGLVHELTCDMGLAVEKYYGASDCTNDSKIFDFLTTTWGGADPYNYCFDDNWDGIYTYYTVECKVATTTAYPDTTSIPDSIDTPEGSIQCVLVYSLFISSGLLFYIF